MKLKNIIALAFISLLFAGCGQSRQGDWRHPQTFEESVLAVFDSLATPEQLALKEKLRDFAMTPGITEIRGHRMVIVASEEDFEKQDIDPIYRKFLQMTLDETNDGVEQWLKDSLITEEDIPKMLREAQAEFGKK